MSRQLDPKKAIYETCELTLIDRCVMSAILNDVIPVKIPYVLNITIEDFHESLENLDNKNIIKYKNSIIVVQPVIAWQIALLVDRSEFISATPLESAQPLADRKTREMLVTNFQHLFLEPLAKVEVD